MTAEKFEIVSAHDVLPLGVAETKFMFSGMRLFSDIGYHQRAVGLPFQRV